MKIGEVVLFTQAVTSEAEDATVYEVRALEAPAMALIRPLGATTDRNDKWIDVCYLRHPTLGQTLNHNASRLPA